MSLNSGIITRSMKKKCKGPPTDNSDNMDYSDTESLDDQGNIKNLISYSDEEDLNENLDFYESENEYSDNSDNSNSVNEYYENKKQYNRYRGDLIDGDIINIAIDELPDDEEKIKEIISSYISNEFIDNHQVIKIPSENKFNNKWDHRDNNYFKNLIPEDKEIIMSIENDIKAINTNIIPLRFQILESGLDLDVKALAIRKIETLKNLDPSGTEYYKIKNWVDGLLNIPFGIYSKLSIGPKASSKAIRTYLQISQSHLNNAIYGHFNAKCHILQIISQWIVNPSSVGNALAIHGPMGIGKTTLVKEGISKALNKPYAFISLGGSTDSSYLDGHSYTYEGSEPGRIIDILKKTKCMDPVIYFDELDKVSETSKGEEIINLLVIFKINITPALI